MGFCAGNFLEGVKFYDGALAVRGLTYGGNRHTDLVILAMVSRVWSSQELYVCVIDRGVHESDRLAYTCSG